MEKYFCNIIETMGEDLTRTGLLETPARAAQAYEFLTEGYNQDLDKIVNGAIYPCESHGMVIVQDIEMYSLCEHHVLPFFGKCHIAYLPNNQILGLSKFARIVDMFSRRLQVQEVLTEQIASAVNEVINPKGVCVILEAQHLCMMMRGIQKQHSTTTTVAHLGLFETNKDYVKEFLTLLKR